MKKVRMFYLNYRTIFLALVIVGFSFLMSMVFYGLDLRTNHQQIQRMEALEKVSLGFLVDALEKDEVASVEMSVLRTGSVGDGAPTTVFFVSSRKDTTYAVMLPQNLANADMLKPLYEALGRSSIPLTSGFDFFKPHMLSGLIALLPFMTLMLFVLLAAQEIQRVMVTRHNVKPQAPDREVMLDDVIGHEGAKDELKRIRDHMKNPGVYQKNGLRAPCGILFSGDPGVGKTLLAKAFANEIEAPFYSVAASDFVELYVGVGARRVRSLFLAARRDRRAVIFIDEFDAIGSRDDRNSDSERLSTLNALLTEMDGVNGNGNLLILAATNRVDKIDSALKRPGRFDKIIRLDLPNQAARRLILERYSRDVNLSSDVDMDRLSSRTAGYSGAQIRELVEEAKRHSWNEKVSHSLSSDTPDFQVTAAHFLTAQETILMGPGTNTLHPNEVERVSVHELGHALAGYHCCAGEMVIEKVTIEGKGASLGYTITTPSVDRRLRTRESLMGEMTMLLGGRAAEEVMLGNVSSGAKDDLDRANALAFSMVAELGMGKTQGLRTWNSTMSAVPPRRVETDIESLLGDAYREALSLISRHRSWMTEQAATLRRNGISTHEVLFGSESARLLLSQAPKGQDVSTQMDPVAI